MSGHPCFASLASLPDRSTPCRPASAEASNARLAPRPIPSDAFQIRRLYSSDPLHAMAFKDLFTRRTQLCAVLLQAVLNGCIITQLFSAKAGSIARTSLLLLWCSAMATLCPCRT